MMLRGDMRPEFPVSRHFFFGPNTGLSLVPCSHTVCSSLNVAGQVSHPYKKNYSSYILISYCNLYFLKQMISSITTLRTPSVIYCCGYFGRT